MQCKDTGIIYTTISHTGTPPQPQNRLVNSQSKMHKDTTANSPLPAFFISCLASSPMKCLRQGETGSIPWNHWYEKTETSQVIIAFRASSSPYTEMQFIKELASGGPGHCHRQLVTQPGQTTATCRRTLQGEVMRASCWLPKSTLEEGVKEMRGRTVAAHTTSFHVSSTWLIGNCSNVHLKYFFTTACSAKINLKRPKTLNSKYSPINKIPHLFFQCSFINFLTRYKKQNKSFFVWISFLREARGEGIRKWDKQYSKHCYDRFATVCFPVLSPWHTCKI